MAAGPDDDGARRRAHGRRAAARDLRRLARLIRRDAKRELRASKRERRRARRAEERERKLAARAQRHERRFAERARRHERELEKRRRTKLAREFGAPIAPRRPRLRGIAAVRAFLRTNTTPVFVVSPTPFNLLGLDRWVHDLYFLSYVDPFDGAHPRVFAPPRPGWAAFRSVDEMNQAVLRHPDTAVFVGGKGPGGRALLLAPDAETERLAKGLGLDVMLPPSDIRARLATTSETTGRAITGPLEAAGAEEWIVSYPAVATSRGTVVGPAMSRLAATPWLTPFSDAPCGTEMWAGVVGHRARRRARRLARRTGDRLVRDGYRGAFEAVVAVVRGRARRLDVRPRIGGVASLTNASAGAYSDIPLLGFHVLEHLGVDYRLDLRDIRSRWKESEVGDPWTQLVVRDLEPRVELLTEAPRTGIWRLTEEGDAVFDRPALDWHGLLDESEAFVLRIVPAGDFRYRGVELATLVVRGRMRGEGGELDDRARAWVEALRGEWRGIAVRPEGDGRTPSEEARAAATTENGAPVGFPAVGASAQTEA